MTAGDLQALEAEAREETRLVQGMTEQVRLRSLTNETYGLPPCDAHLIAKLRNMDPELLAQIRGTTPAFTNGTR